jgi:hypothetical protein
MIDFPAAPVAGQIFFASNGAVYQYNSTYTSWLQIASSVLQDASFTAIYSGADFAMAAGVLVPNTILTGNAGGWYNTANGRFTPPVGRYQLIGGLSALNTGSSFNTVLSLRKNGANLLSHQATSSGVNAVINPTVAAAVDANGTDFFELHSLPNIASTGRYIAFTAFPLSQAAAIPGGGSSWRQIARTVVAAPQASIDFQNIPSDINDIEVNFDLLPVNNGVDAVMQWYDAAGVLVLAGYGSTLAMSTNGQALGTAPFVFNNASAGGITNGIIMDYAAGSVRVGNTAAGGIRGTVRMNDIRNASRPQSMRFQTDYLSDDLGTFRQASGAGWRSAAAAISGVRFLFGSGNIAAGSTVTLWGSP